MNFYLVILCLLLNAFSWMMLAGAEVPNDVKGQETQNEGFLKCREPCQGQWMVLLQLTILCNVRPLNRLRVQNLLQTVEND